MKSVLVFSAIVSGLLFGCSSFNTGSGASGASSNSGTSSAGDAAGTGHYGSYGRISESPGPGSGSK